MASVSFSHFGVMKYQIPAPAPGRVTPRMRRITSTTYGKVAVKYTTCRNHHRGVAVSGGAAERQSVISIWTRAPRGLFSPKLFQDGEHSKNTETEGESVRARNKVSRGTSKAVRVIHKWLTP